MNTGNFKASTQHLLPRVINEYAFYSILYLTACLVLGYELRYPFDEKFLQINAFEKKNSFKNAIKRFSYLNNIHILL